MIKNFKEYLHYLFIPSEKNNFRAKTLQHDFLTYYLALAFAFVFLVRNFGVPISHVLGIATDITVDKLIEYTNAERQRNDLSPLSYNQKLSDAARKKAEDMLAKNYWTHFAPDGRTPWDFILDAGYSYEFAGENLAKNFLFSKNVVDAWMQSPIHRENVLRLDYTDVGYAVVNGIINDEPTTLVVQMFGKPSTGKVTNVQALTRPQPKEFSSPAQEQTAVSPNTNILATKQSLKSTAASGLSVYAAYLFLFFLTMVVAIDFYVASRLNVIRIHGKSFAHFIFLVAVFFGLFLFISRGTIL